MQQENGLNRRAFLRNAGMTAVLGAVGTRGAFAEEMDAVSYTHLTLPTTPYV